jgi:hypothetical protein
MRTWGVSFACSTRKTIGEKLASNGPEKFLVLLEAADDNPRWENDGATDDIVAGEPTKTGEEAYACGTREMLHESTGG